MSHFRKQKNHRKKSYKQMERVNHPLLHCEYGLIKLTSVIEFASFLEPNSDTFHELFCLFSFDKIAVTIPDTRAAFLIWN